MDSALASYINKNLLLVNFKATSTDTILFKNEKILQHTHQQLSASHACLPIKQLTVSVSRPLYAR